MYTVQPLNFRRSEPVVAYINLLYLFQKHYGRFKACSGYAVLASQNGTLLMFFIYIPHLVSSSAMNIKLQNSTLTRNRIETMYMKIVIQEYCPESPVHHFCQLITLSRDTFFWSSGSEPPVPGTHVARDVPDCGKSGGAEPDELKETIFPASTQMRVAIRAALIPIFEVTFPDCALISLIESALISFDSETDWQ